MFDFQKMPFDEQRGRLGAAVEACRCSWWTVAFWTPRARRTLTRCSTCVDDTGTGAGVVEWTILSTSMVVGETSRRAVEMSYADLHGEDAAGELLG